MSNTPSSTAGSCILTTMTDPHRNTIHVEHARVLAHEHYDGAQHIISLEAPKTAQAAQPGSFVHIQCDPQLPMRRPLSIMRTDPQGGRVDLLYKAVGLGTRLLSEKQPGDTLSLMGPIGTPFRLEPTRPRTLLIGGGVGMPPMVFLAEALRQQEYYRPFVILGSEVPFPFTPRPSQILVSGMPDGVIASMPLLEDWGIACRLASLQGYAGCFEGYVTDLARAWLDALDDDARNEVILYSCGPHPMLEAVARLAQEYALPCQVSLEEYMACAVGGCAGCVVKVKTTDGVAMKRVCVDGPVFDAYAVFN